MIDDFRITVNRITHFSGLIVQDSTCGKGNWHNMKKKYFSFVFHQPTYNSNPSRTYYPRTRRTQLDLFAKSSPWIRKTLFTLYANDVYKGAKDQIEKNGALNFEKCGILLIGSGNRKSVTEAYYE